MIQRTVFQGIIFSVMGLEQNIDSKLRLKVSGLELEALKSGFWNDKNLRDLQRLDEVK